MAFSGRRSRPYQVDFASSLGVRQSLRRRHKSAVAYCCSTARPVARRGAFPGSEVTPRLGSVRRCTASPSGAVPLSRRRPGPRAGRVGGHPRWSAAGVPFAGCGACACFGWRRRARSAADRHQVVAGVTDNSHSADYFNLLIALGLPTPRQGLCSRKLALTLSSHPSSCASGQQASELFPKD